MIVIDLNRFEFWISNYFMAYASWLKGLQLFVPLQVVLLKIGIHLSPRLDSSTVLLFSQLSSLPSTNDILLLSVLYLFSGRGPC